MITKMGLCVICTCVIAASLASAIEARVYQASVTVCPYDYSPYYGCVTLDQLHMLYTNLITVKSNTIFTFAPATFKMKQDLVIRFENVANITLESAGAVIYCDGENAGFVFSNVSEVVVQNMNFIGCAANMFEPTAWIRNILFTYRFASCTFRVKDSINITFLNLTFKNVHGCGVYYHSHTNSGYFKVLNSVFTGMHGPGVVVYSGSRSHPVTCNVTIANSQFQDSQCNASYNFSACAIQIATYFVRTDIVNVSVTNTTRTSDMHGVILAPTSYQLIRDHYTVQVRAFNYSNNRAIIGDSSKLCLADIIFKQPQTNFEIDIKIVDSLFLSNSATRNTTKTTGKKVFCAILKITSPSHISREVKYLLQNTTISNSTGWYNSIIHIYSREPPRSLFMNMVYVTNSTIANNVMSTDYYQSATVCARHTTIAVQDSTIANNSATGLLIGHSDIHFRGHTVLQGNHGYNGGGIALHGTSTLSFHNASVLFEGNVADNVGGGLYAQLELHSDTHCFFDFTDSVNSITFRNNVATAGRDWYGGNLDSTCSGYQYLADLVPSIELTSDPWHVCDCTRSNEDCINVVRTIHRVQAYPGQLFNLSLIAVGTVLNTTTLSGVPSAIYAGLLPPDSSNPGRVSNDSLVHAGKRVCSELLYRIISTNQQEVMVLSIEDSINKIPDYYLSVWKLSLRQWYGLATAHESTVPAYVEIELLPCPLGFESPAGECTCSDFLKDYDVNCSIDTMLITKKPHIWLSTEQDANSSIMFLAHRHCPFDYCKPGTVAYSLDSPDAQCSGRHSGILCGECKPDYSLTLGKSECRQCTNLYLLLLIPFALAGVLLIVFLSLTDMAVTAGTINGLLFFANIVRENHATFFPPQAADSFLSVFIAWLNLDVGITTCFFDGLDSYVFTWLQFSFPIYIWFLAFSIIIASRHVDFVSKLYGRNIVPVLATLFLLSYTRSRSALPRLVAPQDKRPGPFPRPLFPQISQHAP